MISRTNENFLKKISHGSYYLKDCGYKGGFAFTSSVMHEKAFPHTDQSKQSSWVTFLTCGADRVLTIKLSNSIPWVMFGYIM
jgi:hypothetical protein